MDQPASKLKIPKPKLRIQPVQVSDSKWYCYILKSLDTKHPNLTYNGSTNNLNRRLRQHNGEIVGGAKQTSRARPWQFIALLSGFPDHKNTLSCEWRIRHPTNKRKRPTKYRGPRGRVKSLELVLQTERWTKPCTHNNQSMQLQLQILDVYKGCIDLSQLPDNVSVHFVQKFDY